MKTNLLKLLMIVFAFSFAGLLQAQTSIPENVTEVIQKYQRTAFHSNNNLDALSEIYGSNLKSTTTTYEINGDVVTEFLIMEWDNGEWVNMMKLDYGYDNNDFLIEMTSYIWQDEAWLKLGKTEYTNNSNGDPTEAHMYNWNAGTQEWTLTFRDTYTYNSSGLCTNLLEEMWMVTDWMNSSKEEYSYDGNGNMTESDSWTWDFMSSAWQNNTMYSYTYSGNQLTEELSKTWQDNAWVNEYNTFWTYGGGEYFTEVLKKKWETGQWVNFSHGTQTFNGSGTVDIYLEEKWENAAWVNDLKQLYTYDGDGHLTEILSQTWVSGAWENEMKFIYSITVGVNEPSMVNTSGFNLTNSPNPFSSETTITFDLTENAFTQLEIFNLVGKKVASLLDAKLIKGNYSIAWDGKAGSGKKLNPGVYLFRLNVNGASVVKKLTLTY